MKNPNRLKLSCRPLPSFDCSNWESVEQAFSTSDHCQLQQAWREEQESDFASTLVRVGWRENTLWVQAEMEDVDIFNAATHLNQETYSLGDVFEMFLRPATQETYYELHVTPENQQLQLKFQSSAAQAKSSGLSSHFVTGLLQSHTIIQHDHHRWRALAAIPAVIAESKTIQSGDVWLFSFSRYDYTHGREKPVISSSSPHEISNFHRQQEWGELTFSGE